MYISYRFDLEEMCRGIYNAVDALEGYLKEEHLRVDECERLKGGAFEEVCETKQEQIPRQQLLKRRSYRDIRFFYEQHLPSVQEYLSQEIIHSR